MKTMPHEWRENIAWVVGVLAVFIFWSFRNNVIYEKPEEEVPFWWRWFHPDEVVILEPRDDRYIEPRPETQVSVESRRTRQ